MDSNMEEESIQIKIGQLSDNIKNLTRRMDDMQKTVELLFKDREILEDIQGSIRAFQEISLQTRNHHDNNIQSLKTEIKDSQFHIEDKLDEKVGEVGEKIEEKTVIVKTEKDNLFKKFRKLLGGDRNGTKSNEKN